MTFATAIFLIVVGAILRYAVNFNIGGIEEETVGLILMIAGVAGLVVAAFQEIVWTVRSRRGEPLERDR